MESQTRIAIIGAGASGMTAAITAARNGAEVTLFEKNDRVGKKILATGNGKCNLSNLEFGMEQYYCEDKDKLDKLFSIFPVYEAISFFENLGLMIKSKNGYLYPYSEQASSVLDVLRMELKRCRVRDVTGAEIVDAVYCARNGTFQLKDRNGKPYHFDKVVIACGSPASLKKGEGMSGYELAKQFGHKINPIVPGLVQLRSDDSFIRALAGVRCQAKVKLLIDEQEAACETGEMQFTEYGISGIPVFQMSRIAAYALRENKSVTVVVDFFPDWESKAFAYISRLRYDEQSDKTLEDYLTGTQNKKINMVMVRLSGLKPGMKAEEAGWKKVWTMMQKYRAFEIHISQVNSMENAQICAGGVDFRQVSMQLESNFMKGLYFAGEILDVDGKCGGYNLQWAWTSGYLAGFYAAGGKAPEFAEVKEEQKIN